MVLVPVSSSFPAPVSKQSPPNLIQITHLWRAVFLSLSIAVILNTNSNQSQLDQYCCCSNNLSLSLSPQLPCFKPEQRVQRRDAGGAAAIAAEPLHSRRRPPAWPKGGAGEGRAYPGALLRPSTDQVSTNALFLSILYVSALWDRRWPLKYRNLGNESPRSRVMRAMPGLDLIRFLPDPFVFQRKSFSFGGYGGIYSCFRRDSCLFE